MGKKRRFSGCFLNKVEDDLTDAGKVVLYHVIESIFDHIRDEAKTDLLTLKNQILADIEQGSSQLFEEFMANVKQYF